MGRRTGCNWGQIARQAAHHFVLPCQMLAERLVASEVVYGSGLDVLVNVLWRFHEAMRLLRTHDNCLRPSELSISIRKVLLLRR